MKTFRRNPIEVQAVRWNGPGDCPGVTLLSEVHPDRNLRLPDEMINVDYCGRCKRLLADHGWMWSIGDVSVVGRDYRFRIEQSEVIVCPGNWIVKEEGQLRLIYTHNEFVAAFHTDGAS